MTAASLIKLYIAGAVYENYDKVRSQEASTNDTEALLNNMISVSDNDSANTLVKRLGNGDENRGMKIVNEFCKKHSFDDTEMNRLMLVNNGTENYTSVKDLIRILKAYYNGELDGSENVISYMKTQDRRGKIPAGIPEGITVANKTGELANVENDAAIVFLDDSPYILCVMTEDLSDSYDTIGKIGSLSRYIYKNLRK
jgi:beta-lactamase class A